MLKFLGIRDFVIVDRIDLEFSPGFTVLTGETGAGKSILIDALSLVLGERSDASAVRNGCERAEISAEFEVADLPDVIAWLHENGLENQEDEGVCLLRSEEHTSELQSPCNLVFRRLLCPPCLSALSLHVALPISANPF